MTRSLTPLLALLGFAHLAAAQTASLPNEGARLTPGATSGTYSFSWWGRAGISYFIQHSDDLLTWEYLPVIESGTNRVIDWGFTSSHDKFFLRLKLTDAPVSGGDPFSADFDGDGVSNWQELLNGTDPFDFYNGTAPILTIDSGDNQSGLRSSFLPQPLVVQVAGANAVPISNVPLTISATAGALLGETSANGSPLTTTLSVRTQFDGRATVFCYSPPLVGSFTVFVTGTAPGATLTAAFHETSTGAAVTPPGAPGNVKERWLGPKTLQWTWEDNSDNEAEFIIERQNPTGEWVELGRVGPNTTSFTYTIPD